MHAQSAQKYDIIANDWRGLQNSDAEFHAKGPNPTWDVMRFGGYIGPNYATPTTGSISGGSATLNVTSAMDFAVGQGILVLRAGTAPAIATPQAPTVTPIAQAGSTSYSYCIVDTDWFGGHTPCSPAGSTSIGPAAFGLQGYSISSWSSSNSVITVTTSAPHNIPTSKYANGQLWPQVEVQQGTTNSAYCEGAVTLTNVPSRNTVQFTRYGVSDSTMNRCSRGTLRVLPRIILKWDSRYAYAVRNAACSGGTAKLTVTPTISGPNHTWIVPYGVRATITGVSDSHYNTSTTVNGWSQTSSVVSYPIVGGSCSGVNTGGLGGTVSLVPGKAVKNHLIYRCSGASCLLPTNASHYSLVGVAVGNDGYFVDSGLYPSPTAVDLGDLSSTAPRVATNDYLSTTITAINGTTFTLAAKATNTVSGAKVSHDNTPNLLATCAAMPGGNSGHIIVPAATVPDGSSGAEFPIMANFDTNPWGGCHAGTTFDFRSQVWQDGTILVGKEMNFIASEGAAGCAGTMYPMGPAVCINGFANPFFYFEPEQSSNNFFQNLVILPNQPYQSAFYFDQQLNDDGNTGERFDNVHVNGQAGSLPIVDKGGFGRFWNFGGWSAAGGNFATQRTYTFTQNCGMPNYVESASSLGTYVTETHSTYNFGTIEVDGCGMSGGNWTNATFNNMLVENMYGPAFKFDTLPYGISQIAFNLSGYADLLGGGGTPFYDMANSATYGVRFMDNQCGTGTQPLLETGNTTFAGITISSTGAAACSIIGGQSYRYENLAANVTINANFSQQLTGSSQVFSAMGAPGNFQSVIQLGPGNWPVGSYQFCLTATDALGGETAYNQGSCTNLTVTGHASVIQMVMPAAFPAGATGLNVYINNGLINANSCHKPQYTTPGGRYTFNSSALCGGGMSYGAGTAVSSAINSTAVAAPKLLLNGELTASVARSEQNIFLPGALTSTWTASSWTPDRPITVTRLQAQAKTAPTSCSTNAIVRLTDGTTPINLTISAASNDSGSISQNYGAGSTLTVSVQTAASGCGTSPADANVTVQYRMQ